MHDEQQPQDANAELRPEDFPDLDLTDPVLDQLQQERDEFEERYKRALADSQNIQRRAVENEREARRQGASGVLQAIIPILDNFELALSHEVADPGAKQVIDGIRAIQASLLDALSRHGVGVIKPEVASDFDPMRHEALIQQAADGAPAGTVSGVIQIGYTLGERVIRPAKVMVAPEDAGVASDGAEE